jgi:hypothetical protein
MTVGLLTLIWGVVVASAAPQVRSDGSGAIIAGGVVYAWQEARVPTQVSISEGIPKAAARFCGEDMLAVACLTNDNEYRIDVLEMPEGSFARTVSLDGRPEWIAEGPTGLSWRVGDEILTMSCDGSLESRRLVQGDLRCVELPFRGIGGVHSCGRKRMVRQVERFAQSVPHVPVGRLIRRGEDAWHVQVEDTVADGLWSLQSFAMEGNAQEDADLTEVVLVNAPGWPLWASEDLNTILFSGSVDDSVGSLFSLSAERIYDSGVVINATGCIIPMYDSAAVASSAACFELGTWIPAGTRWTHLNYSDTIGMQVGPTRSTNSSSWAFLAATDLGLMGAFWRDKGEIEFVGFPSSN